jgi:hypothetical protein
MEMDGDSCQKRPTSLRRRLPLLTFGQCIGASVFDRPSSGEAVGPSGVWLPVCQDLLTKRIQFRGTDCSATSAQGFGKQVLG